MNFSVGAKIKLMRESERLVSRPEVAKMLGVAKDAYWRYEEDKTVPNTEVMMKILSHPKFEKYTLWFMTGKIAPEAGQIAPVLAHYGQGETELSVSERKIG